MVLYLQNKSLLRFFIFVCLLACFSFFGCQVSSSEFKIKKIGKGLSNPWGIAVLSEDEILVTERVGNLYKINLINGSTKSIKNVPEVVAQRQGGLLDILVDKKSKNNIYLCFSKREAEGVSTALSVSSLKNNELVSTKILFSSNNRSNSTVHFGCRIGIKDKFVYMSIGDRGDRHQSQNTLSHAGSIIKVNKYDGSTHESSNIENNWLPELFTKGHRNPQGMAINSVTGDIWINEHGPKGGDEINVLKRGRNYGWPVVTHGKEYFGGKIGEGIKTLKGFQDPIWVWIPSIAPSGMAFYEGDMFPEFKGHLLVSSLKFKSLYLVKLSNGLPYTEEFFFKNKFGRIRDIEVLNDGSIVIINDLKNGGIYHIYR